VFIQFSVEQIRAALITDRYSGPDRNGFALYGIGLVSLDNTASPFRATNVAIGTHGSALLPD
jgi:hypothetical protein